jgi:hypothetical protein
MHDADELLTAEVLHELGHELFNFFRENSLNLFEVGACLPRAAAWVWIL